MELTASTILSRCELVASTPKRYDFPGRHSICEQYDALVRLFSRLDPASEEDMIVGALAVYGWMPTMMDKLVARDELKRLIDELARAEANQVTAALERGILSGALRSVNNSIVGTSKLLHFFLPDKVAIWDSVLAGSFGFVHHYQFAKEALFVEYVRAVHAAAESETMPWQRLDIALGASGDVSRVRRIEFALYAFARAQGAKGVNLFESPSG
jgi:hypothetical protein